MRPAPDPQSLRRDRVRRALVALLILCLVLLPLYLWPLRGRIPGLPGAAALSGSTSDPRNPGAVARIPGDVWDALMGRVTPPPPSSAPSRPRNLTMVTMLEGTPGTGPFETLTPSGPHASVIASLLGEHTPPEGAPSDAGSPSSSPSSEPGTGNAPGGFGSGGYPAVADLGPWGGGGGGGGGGGSPFGSASDPIWTPDDPGPAAPGPRARPKK
jgi:hypothetical protein